MIWQCGNTAAEKLDAGALQRTMTLTEEKMEVSSRDGDASAGTDLEREAMKRKRRIEAMRQLREQQHDPTAGQESDEQHKLPRPMFRSYKPLDKELQKSTLPDAKPEKIDSQLTSELDKSKEAPVLNEIDLVNLAPRKPDWDLKRDVAKKLAKLEKRTQRAIAVLIRERLMENKQDLAAAVNALN